jgi:hypothetical protein
LAIALVTASKIVTLDPALLKLIPRPLLEMATSRVLRSEEKKGTGKYAPMRELLPAIRYDLKEVSEMDGKAESFKLVKAEILLVGGTKSPTYLKNGLAALETILPKVRRDRLEGPDHSGTWISDQRGNPELVAQSLRRFFRE